MFWKLDGLRLPNDGRCPHCGHDTGPRFGRFECPECGAFVADNDMDRKLVATDFRGWVKIAVGGVAFGLAIILLAVFFE